MRKIYIYSAIGVAILLAITALAVYLHTANIPVLEPAGPIAIQERAVIVITLLLCAIVVVPVFVLLFLFAWKYRSTNAKADARYSPEGDHANLTIEFTWWLVPAVIIAVLSVIMWQSSHALDPYKPLPGNSMVVEVVALDWKWLFIYPAQGIASLNLLEIPKDVPVTFKLTADAPMNSFWIPQLGGQIMVMPGMVTDLNLMASKLGTFDGFSANISGQGFAGMAFKVNSVSLDDFNAWVQSARESSSTPLTLAAYNTLAEPSEYNAVARYAPVDDNLYADIVMKYMMASTTTPVPSSMQMSGMSGMDMTNTMP